VLLTAIQVNRGDDAEARRAFGEAARVLGETKAVERVWPTLHGITPDPTSRRRRSTGACAGPSSSCAAGPSRPSTRP